MSCYLCGGNSFEIIFEYDKLDKYEEAVIEKQPDYSRKWVRCQTCNLVYSITNFVGDINFIYSGKYRSKEFRGETPEEMFNKISSLPKDQSENHYRIQYLKEAYDRINPMYFNTTKKKQDIKKILDVGFGFCIFLGEYISPGWEGYGIDPDASCCEFASKKLNINTHNGFYKKGIFNIKFDVITLIHVLEHFKDPITLLRDIHTDLDVNGLAYIEVPDDVEFYLFDKDHDEFNSCHYYMFNLPSLSKMLTIAGFRVVDARAILNSRGYRRIMAIAIKDNPSSVI